VHGDEIVTTTAEWPVVRRDPAALALGQRPGDEISGRGGDAFGHETSMPEPEPTVNRKCTMAEPGEFPRVLDREGASELLTGIRATRARRRLSDFIRYAWHVLEPGVELEWNWHIDALADHIQWVLENWMRKQRDRSYEMEVQNLLINIPPGTMKSRIVMVCAHAWMWIHCPSWRLIALSANPEVAQRDARYTRDLITSEWYQTWFRPTWTIKEDQDAVSNFANTAGGSRQSKGITAQIVGQRADALFVDDPQDPKEAHSEAARRAVITAWDSAIENRVNDLRSSVRIGVMQRLHEADWSAHVLGQGKWHHLCLPLEFETHRHCRTAMPVDAKNRYRARLTASGELEGDDRVGPLLGWADPRVTDGEILHRARFTPQVVLEQKAKGSLYYAGQQQQRPAPMEGGIFKRRYWKFFRLIGEPAGPHGRPHGCLTESELAAREVDPKRFDWISVTVDATFGKSANADNVGLLVIAGIKADRFVLFDGSKKMDILETIAAIKRMRSFWPSARKTLIEKKANGDAILTILGPELPGLIPVEPEGGKVARANAMQPSVESGNWYLLEGAAWLDDLVDEFATFPNGAHDDRVDGCSQLAIYYGISPAAARFGGLCTM
jgi:predicted phage terminase large subunit-like protein